MMKVRDLIDGITGVSMDAHENVAIKKDWPTMPGIASSGRKGPYLSARQRETVREDYFKTAPEEYLTSNRTSASRSEDRWILRK
jgi:hypothetical protein